MKVESLRDDDTCLAPDEGNPSPGDHGQYDLSPLRSTLLSMMKHWHQRRPCRGSISSHITDSGLRCSLHPGLSK